MCYNLFMSQTERIYHILRVLSNNERLLLKDVAVKFEVSSRQVGRDIEYLRNRMECDIVYDRKMKAYVLDDNDNKAYFEYKFLIMESLMESLLGRLPFTATLSKDVKNTLSSIMSDSTKSVLDKIIYHAPRIDLPSYDIFSVLVKVMSNNGLLRIEYVNRSQMKSERTVEPKKLLNYDSLWYLVAYDHKSEELRTFHLSRIQSADEIKGQVVFNDDEKLSAFIETGFGIFLSGNLEPYVMRFTGNAAFQIKTEIWHEKQVLKSLDNGEVELTVPAKQPYELVSRLLTFSGEGYPVSSDSFVAEFSSAVKKLMKMIK